MDESVVSQVTEPKQLTQQSDGALTETNRLSHKVRKAVAADDDDTVDSEPADSASIPQVLLSTEHSAMCRVRVGDRFPEITLPQLSGAPTDLATLGGRKATVVLFWRNDPWMSATALQDLSKIIVAFEDVSVVGIAVKESEREIESAIKGAGAEFPQLLDSDGKAFNQVGMVKMPRVYVLDDAGRIVWFDIEYSQSTQRELNQTLEALTRGS